MTALLTYRDRGAPTAILPRKPWKPPAGARGPFDMAGRGRRFEMPPPALPAQAWGTLAVLDGWGTGQGSRMNVEPTAGADA